MIGSINFIEKNKKLTAKQKQRVEDLTIKNKSKKITEKELVRLDYLKKIPKQKTIQTVLRDQNKIVSKQKFLEANKSEIPKGIFDKLLKDVKKDVLKLKKLPKETKSKKVQYKKNITKITIEGKLKTITDAIEKNSVLQKMQINSENLIDLDMSDYIINGKSVTKDFFTAYPLSFILPPKIYFYLNISFLLTFCEINIDKENFEKESQKAYINFLKDIQKDSQDFDNIYTDKFGNQVSFSSQESKRK